MLTLLTTVKAFNGAADVIQRSALRSWLVACPDAEIVMFGPCEGAAEVCRAFGIQQVVSTRRAASGVPYFEDVAAWAATCGRADLQVYLNADILLPPDFEQHLSRVSSSLLNNDFLLLGQRIDLPQGQCIDGTRFYDQLRDLLRSGQAQLHRPTGMDYFVFRRGMWRDLPSLIMGRGGCDSALVAYCLRRKIPVIDASFAFPVVHQWHDYGHVDGGKPEAHYGEESQFNFRNHGLRDFAPHCLDANLTLMRSGRLAPNPRRSWLRWLECEGYYRRGWRMCPRFNQLWHVLRRGGFWVDQPEWGG